MSLFFFLNNVTAWLQLQVMTQVEVRPEYNNTAVQAYVMKLER
jgi:hypothetical protein